MPKKRTLQTHGRNSKVYVPILLHIFNNKYREEDTAVAFTLEDIRQAAIELNIKLGNPSDVIYRMRSRTVLPKELLDKGFYLLRQVNRGKYQLEVGSSSVIDHTPEKVISTLDITPLPVRRLLPENLSDIDEQGLLTIAHYCQLLSHFTGLQVFRFKSHVRRSVLSVGQVEVDEVDVGVALDHTEKPIIFPIEAKAAPDALNWIQVSAQVMFAKQHFPGHTIRRVSASQTLLTQQFWGSSKTRRSSKVLHWGDEWD